MLTFNFGSPDGTDFMPERDNPTPANLELLPLNTTLDPASPFATVLTTWNRRRTGAHPPEWTNFDFTDFRGWHSHLKVSVFPDERPDPLFRIMGEAWRSIAMGYLAGKRFSDVRPKIFERQFRDHFKAIRDNALIGRTRSAVSARNRGFTKIEVLELPVGRDGQRVGGLLHCLHVLE